MAQDCLIAFQANPLFFKGNSAALWRNEGQGSHLQFGHYWHVLQREGYAHECIAGGGRFYFTMFVSNIVSTDIGVCAPATCTNDEVTWGVIPALYEDLFFSDARFQFAAQLREFRHISLRDIGDNAPGASTCLAVLCVVSLIAMLLRRRKRSTGVPRAKTSACWDRLHEYAAIGFVVGEVMQYSRWNDYTWHAAHSRLYSAAVDVGRCAREMLAVIQLVRIVNSCMEGEDGQPSPRFCRLFHVCGGIAQRFVQLSVLSLTWVLVACALQPTLVVNVFADAAWKRTWPTSLSTCVDMPTWAMPLAGGVQLWSPEGSADGPCLNLQMVRTELWFLVASAPALFLASVLGVEVAALASFALAYYIHAGVDPEVLVGLRSLRESLVALLPRTVNPLDLVLIGFGLLLASVGARLNQRQSKRSSIIILGVLAAVFYASQGTLLHWYPDASLESIPNSIFLAACCMIFVIAYHAFGPGSGLLPGVLSEDASTCMIPAIPLVVFVLEGHFEPHAKWLTWYDFLVRCVGVFSISALLGVIIAGICFAATSITSAILRLLAWSFARVFGLCSSVLKSSLKLSLDNHHGETLCHCRCSIFAIGSLLAAAVATALYIGTPIYAVHAAWTLAGAERLSVVAS
eukprot:TRINITY_DN24674_c0_g1_i1.p1 TRINITY_DN24674_c0_g1~~TRINITY_DN24674_c0_g1_i1.p1  ORF type:complete len:630 (+),score=70.20 TRINITY_DN24674_c0_g1_i1:52-1941(+)